MALENTDVFVVQKQDGAKENRKLSFQQLQEALGSGPSVVFKGVANMTSADTQPGTNGIPAPSNGDLWINSTAGQFAWTSNVDANSYTGAVQVDSRAIWTGTGWSVTNPPSGDVGVEEVKGTLPVTVDSGTPSAPIVAVNAAATNADGSTQTSGVVTIATDANVAAGDDNLVVTSKQLKATNDLISQAGGGTVTNVTGTAPIEVSDGTSQPVVSITNASSSDFGAVKLIDTGLTEPDTTSTTAAVVPKYLNDFYLIKDFSSLTDVDD